MKKKTEHPVQNMVEEPSENQPSKVPLMKPDPKWNEPIKIVDGYNQIYKN